MFLFVVLFFIIFCFAYVYLFYKYLELDKDYNDLYDICCNLDKEMHNLYFKVVKKDD